jgi:hypothetical protein
MCFLIISLFQFSGSSNAGIVPPKNDATGDLPDMYIVTGTM